MSEQQTTNNIPEELTQQQAIGLLIQGVEMAQSRGAYNLNEAAIIAKAKRAFAPAQETTETTEASTPATTETATID
jgi:hypothetical protein